MSRTGCPGAPPYVARTASCVPVVEVEDTGDDLRRDERLVAERDHGGIDVAERRDAAPQRRGLAFVPVGAHDDPGVAEVGAGADGVGVVAEHDDHRLHGGHRQHRIDGVLQQRASVELGELLGGAEPPPLAGGEDQPADRHTPTSWIRPSACASRPPLRPCRMATISPMIDSAVSSAVSAPRSSPIGARDALEIRLLDALGQQPLAPLGLRAARAHRADVAGVRAQREHERRVVELRVVGEDRDRGRAVDAAELLERLLRPRRDDLLGVREARAAGRTARAGRPRTAASRSPRAIWHSAAAKSTAPNTISRGGGNVTSTNSRRRLARSERSAHISSSASRAACSSSAGSPSEPLRVPSARDQHASRPRPALERA